MVNLEFYQAFPYLKEACEYLRELGLIDTQGIATVFKQLGFPVIGTAPSVFENPEWHLKEAEAYKQAALDVINARKQAQPQGQS